MIGLFQAATYSFTMSLRTFSVIIIFTQALPVSGKLHLIRIFGEPSFDVCIIVTITLVPGAPTKSIAPPIPFTNLPCQLKIGQWMSHRIVMVQNMNNP